MLIALIIYIAFLVGVGIYDAFKVKDFNDYVVAGKRQNTFTVFMSLMASMIGASAAMGIMARVSSQGFPAIWWMAVGTIGLIIQSIFLSEKIRSLDADTLPDVAGKTIGKAAEVVFGIIIAVSWTGIVAAQIVAMTSLISLVTGNSSKTLLIIVALVVILYTLIGGQSSVVKTDVVQAMIIFAGFIACIIYLYFVKGDASNAVASNIEVLNTAYSGKSLIYDLFIVGGTYLLGPDIISRNLLSKDGKTAKKAAGISGIVLLIFAFVVVMIGMWIKYNVSAEELGSTSQMIYLIQNVIPKPIGIILAIGLISALLSTTDTSLINASSIFAKDVCGLKKVWQVRVVVAVLGAISMYIALGQGDIISILTGAYSVYAPGVVFPLLIAILCYKKKDINKIIWLVAVIAGGTCGILKTYLKVDIEMLPLYGMLASLVLALASVKWKSNTPEKTEE